MYKLFFSSFSFIGLLFLNLSVNTALAGGGQVYIDAASTPSGWNNSEIRQIVVRVHLHPDVPCIGTNITFKYEDQKEGDYISTGSIDSNVYTIKEEGRRWINGKSVYDCGTYAKYSSKNRELKYAIILVTTPKGETYERKVVLNFQSNEPIESTGDSLPWDTELLVHPTNIPIPSVTLYQKPEDSIPTKKMNYPIISPNSEVMYKPDKDDKSIEELSQKVENLQKQLEQSKKTQNILEQRITNLVNFIKRLFPFFK